MNHTSPDELFPVVDESGNQTALAPRSVCHDGKSMLLHPVIHLHLFNKKGELFLQKRSLNKDIAPGLWDTSVGGHVNPDEKAEEALLRETREELGIALEEYFFLYSYIWQSARERELVKTFKAITSQMISVNHDEISEGKYWSIGEIKKHIGTGIFTPNFEHEFEKLTCFISQQP